MADYLQGVETEYLPQSVLEREDYRYLAKKAQREVVQHYTRRRKDVIHRVSGLLDPHNMDGVEHLYDEQRRTVVMLQYYKPDPSDIDTTDEQKQRFVDAMRAEIAGLVEYMVETEGQEENVDREARGSRSKAYSSYKRLPKGFGRHLQPFDLRPRVTHI
jgi:citrate lyase beta subunit